MKQAVQRIGACLGLGLACLLPVGHSALGQEPEPHIALRGVVIPTGFQGTKYSAMIQVAVNGSPLPDATWDLDASFVPEDRAPKDFSARVAAGEPGAPVVFEVQVEFEPGSYALNLTASETTAGQSGTRQLQGRWPDPNQEPATVSPVVLLQPAQGAFKRGENARGQGALALRDDDPIRTQLPTAAVSVVCRGRTLRGSVRVERKLEGAASVDFKTINLLPGHDRCAQVRDIIPPGTLGAGSFRYEVRLMTDGVEVASGVRLFDTVGT